MTTIHDARRTLLIAGAGDTGSRLAALAATAGSDVLALRRRELPMGPGIRALRADLRSGEGFDAIPKRLDALVFCAAPDERSEAAYRALYRDGLRRLLDRCEIGRVLLVSSTAVYAEDAGGSVDEHTPADATAFNGRVLLEAEHELDAHPDAAAFRASGIYGPGRERMWWRARRDDPGEPRWTNRIHVEDVAAALRHLLDAPRIDRIYCGNDDAPALEHEVIDGLRARLGLPALGHAAGATTGKRVSNARLRASGWRPRFPDWRSGYHSPPPSDAQSAATTR
ncbi:MAG TPA: NAD(P)-dependent oxidoreductase [Xanthomonadaceae bacterium]|jgi:electron-transferring-flavoprotein dehydrogenase|nr:NAD(P)-dependent oxidoreductase [Xanthomonadaceae bacterium]